MQLAIQADMLPGRSVDERLACARDLGFTGVEFWLDDLETDLEDTAHALEQHELAVAAIHLGRSDGYLSVDPDVREAALGRLRAALTLAADFDAPNVVFVPHWGALSTPDLRPYRSAEEIAAELMIWLLRTVSDLAYVFGTTINMQPRHRFETDFLRTVAQAVQFSDVLKNNPHVRIAPCTFDIAMHNSDPAAVLSQYLDRIHYLYLADSNGQLPGKGLIDWQGIAAALKNGGYDGWLCLSSGHPVRDQKARFALWDALPDALKRLEACGLR